MNNSDLLRDLFNRVAQGSIDPSDYRAIRDMIADDESGELAAELHNFHSAKLTTDNKTYDFTYWQSVLNEILATDKTGKTKTTRLVVLSRSRWWIAAAAVIVLFSAGYFLFTQNSEKQPPTANHQPPTNILPGGNKAVLTLGNGSKIILDSMQNGSVAKQGNTNIIKTDSGKLAYNSSTEKPANISYNTLSTPRGGKFQVTLPDGSNVWLNAASSITYPTAFTGKERKVTIIGEAYFEVIHNAKQPFRVEVNGAIIKDLGTHFNINAYSDESAMKVTLIQGAVSITKNTESKSISPNEQALILSNNITIKKNVDVEKVIAWKNGWFELENTPLDELMRQVSRWYDVDLKYEGIMPAIEFGGRISNKLPLSKLLQSLETNGNGIKFRTEGKTLIVHG